MVKSYTFECNDYDETSYDFSKQELKSNPTALEYTKHEFVQQTGTREENNNFGVTPSQCYFTDYSIKTYSIEDNGKLQFNVYVYNGQNGIIINYATGESKLEK